MSTSKSRRQRLRFVRELPAQRYPACDVPLERVPVVSIHLRRCDQRLAAEQERLRELVR